jgi:hypothetical protein
VGAALPRRPGAPQPLPLAGLMFIFGIKPDRVKMGHGVPFCTEHAVTRWEEGKDLGGSTIAAALAHLLTMIGNCAVSLQR